MRIALCTLFIAGCAGGGSTADPADGSSEVADPHSDPATCKSWLVTYDLTGSTFFIQSTQDFQIQLREPYSDDQNMGPGSLVLRLPDVDGRPGPGPVALTEYSLDLNFVVGVTGIADVSTDVLYTAGPEDCGVVDGTLAGTELGWSAPEMESVCQNGEITCSGPLCGQFGAPPADQPEEFVDDCAPQAIGGFTFSADLSTFDMKAVTITEDADSQTALNFHGTQVDAVLDPSPPPCNCR